MKLLSGECHKTTLIKRSSRLSNWFSLPLSPAWWSILRFIFQWISARKRNSSALAMELHLSCPNPSICKWQLRCMFGIVPRHLLLISYIYSCFYTSPKVTLKWFLLWNICLYQEFVLSYSIDIVFFSFDDKWHCWSDCCEMKRKRINRILGQLYDLSLDHIHDLDLGVSRSEFEIALSQEWDGWLTWNKKDVIHPLMTMILTCVTMLGWGEPTG